MPQIKSLYIGAARAGFVRPALALTLTRWPAVFRDCRIGEIILIMLKSD